MSVYVHTRSRKFVEGGKVMRSAGPALREESAADELPIKTDHAR